jgi:carboxymethylenebutenolidase
MTEIQKYLAEEIAEDLTDGIITRREAMRRLGLLGLTASAATTLLATFAAPAVAAPTATAARGGDGDGTVSAWEPVATEAITFPGPNGTLMAAWAPAAKPRGGVLVIHENRGLNDHIRLVAGRFAASGWSALALDLLSEEGGTGTFPDPAQVGAVLGQIDPTRFDADMKAAVTELDKRVRGKLAAIGFCFGGGMIWRLLAACEKRLAAAAPYYGPFPEGDVSFRGNRAAVLAVYGGTDTRVNAGQPAAKAALEAARLEHKLLTFTLAGHAFFNDTNAERFNPHAAAEAWRRTLNWFDDADTHRHGRHDRHD